MFFVSFSRLIELNKFNGVFFVCLSLFLCTLIVRLMACPPLIRWLHFAQRLFCPWHHPSQLLQAKKRKITTKCVLHLISHSKCCIFVIEHIPFHLFERGGQILHFHQLGIFQHPFSFTSLNRSHIEIPFHTFILVSWFTHFVRFHESNSIYSQAYTIYRRIKLTQPLPYRQYHSTIYLTKNQCLVLN